MYISCVYIFAFYIMDILHIICIYCFIIINIAYYHFVCIIDMLNLLFNIFHCF